MKKIIYDFGSNNGDDIPYYLMKADIVIAVEANPTLCSTIQEKFKTAIAEGNLVIENYVLTNQADSIKADFYVHKHKHILSQFPKPGKETIEDFSKINISAITPIELIKKHGHPYYIKIDIEHFDGEILRSIFNEKIFPDYISAESHSPEVFSLLVAEGRYNTFKLVEGSTISKTYKNSLIKDKYNNTQRYSFPHHSAGPFGEDIHGCWMSGEGMLRKLGLYGCGWKDLHATNKTVKMSKFSLKKELFTLCLKNMRQLIKKIIKL